MALGNAEFAEDEDRSSHQDAVLRELRSLRNHLASADSASAGQSSYRLEQVETCVKDQSAVLQKILIQTQCLEGIKQAQEDHEERINQLESDKDKMLGAKAVVGVLVMGGAGAIGAWFKSFIDTHFR